MLELVIQNFHFNIFTWFTIIEWSIERSLIKMQIRETTSSSELLLFRNQPKLLKSSIQWLFIKLQSDALFKHKQHQTQSISLAWLIRSSGNQGDLSLEGLNSFQRPIFRYHGYGSCIAHLYMDLTPSAHWVTLLTAFLTLWACLRHHTQPNHDPFNPVFRVGWAHIFVKHGWYRSW